MKVRQDVYGDAVNRSLKGWIMNIKQWLLQIVSHSALSILFIYLVSFYN